MILQEAEVFFSFSQRRNAFCNVKVLTPKCAENKHTIFRTKSRPWHVTLMTDFCRDSSNKKHTPIDHTVCLDGNKIENISGELKSEIRGSGTGKRDDTIFWAHLHLCLAPLAFFSFDLFSFQTPLSLFFFLTSLSLSWEAFREPEDTGLSLVGLTRPFMTKRAQKRPKKLSRNLVVRASGGSSSEWKSSLRFYHQQSRSNFPQNSSLPRSLSSLSTWFFLVVSCSQWDLSASKPPGPFHTFLIRWHVAAKKRTI